VTPAAQQPSWFAQALQNTVGAGLRWLLVHLLWTWPVAGSTWVGQRIIAEPAAAIAALGAIIAVPLLVSTGIEHGFWGRNVATAWRNEGVARENVGTIERVLAAHETEAPPPVFGWQTRALPDSERRQARRAAWESRRDDLQRALREEQAVVPSWFFPLPPHLPWPESQLGWACFYGLHHFLFGTIYPPIVATYLLVGLLLAWRTSPRRRAGRWRAARAATPRGSLLLGLDADLRPYFLTPADRNRHIFVAGTTGSGKSEALRLLARNDIDAGRGVVFFDMKGDREQAQALFEIASGAGRQDDFLFFTADPKTPCHAYNGAGAADPAVLVDRIMMAGEWSNEPYYPKVAEAVLGRVIPALASRQRLLTLEDVRLAVGDAIGLRLASKWADAREQPKIAADLENFRRYFEDTSGLRHNLDQLCRLRERMCTAAADIDFLEVFGRNRILYIELNAQLQEKLARSIARLMLEDFKQLSGRLSSRPDARHPFSLYIDEARYALYDGFVGLITQCRSAGIGVVLATQSPFDFRNGIDDQVLRAVAQNTNTKLFFCQKDHESAEYCARQAGTCDTIKRTTQMIDEGAFGGQAESGVYSDREVKEFIAHPDELKRMPAGKALLIKGTAECEVIHVEYRPTALRAAFAPVLPRQWRAGDRAQLGHDRPALDLQVLIDAEKAREQGELVKRSEAKTTASGTPEGGVVRKKSERSPLAKKKGSVSS
jgi:hypothetical protein